MLTQQRLKELMHYDPETGLITRLSTGITTGTSNTHGCLVTMVDRKLYLVHRLAFLYMTGRWPAHFVDHRDRDRQNNKWVNLREATSSQNSANVKGRSGLKGASYRHGEWVARIMVNRKHIFLGQFPTEQEAHEAYMTAARQHFGEFASG